MPADFGDGDPFPGEGFEDDRIILADFIDGLGGINHRHAAIKKDNGQQQQKALDEEIFQAGAVE